MMGATKTRSQRRMEKKQTVILLVLVLAVSLASFTLGVVVGRRGAERDFAHRQQAAEKILVTKAPKQSIEAKPEAEQSASAEPDQDEAAATEETKLTFYDSLAKEEKVPLGSGINLPPEEKQQAKSAVQPPIELPEKPIVKKQITTTVAKAEAPVQEAAAEGMAVMLPKVDAQGTYAVQVGSFASATDASAFKKKLVSKNYPAFVAEADLGAKGLWYRVKIGPYKESADAKTVLQLIDKKEQIKGFIARQ